MIYILLSILTVSAVVQTDLVNSEAFNAKYKVAYNFPFYSGMLRANLSEPENTDLTKLSLSHYMFFQSQSNGANDPVLLWLNGGPGCSSLAGAFNEDGPLVFNYNSSTLGVNAESWNQNANVLYIESPLGVGFSYSPNATYENSDEKTAQLTYPELQGRKFFIAGESYAGVYIPTLAAAILNYNKNPFHNVKYQVPKINLQGILVGNGCTHPLECFTGQFVDPIAGQGYSRFQIQFYYDRGFIPQDLYDEFENNLNCSNSQAESCAKLMNKIDVAMANQNTAFDPYNVFDFCLNQTTPSMPLPPCADAIGVVSMLRDQQTMDLLHIPSFLQTVQWNVCANINYVMGSKQSFYVYPQLIEAGIQIWKFSGDIDSVVPITGTLYWMGLLASENNLPLTDYWRPWYFNDPVLGQQIGGFTQSYQGIRLVTVRYAGHMVPQDQRAHGKYMFQQFISGANTI